MATYQEFSKQIKEKYPQYKEVDDLKLAKAMVEKYPEYKDRVVFDGPKTNKQENKGIDITPAGLFKGSQNVVASAITAPAIAKRDNISIKQAYNKNLEKTKEYRKQNPTPVQDFLIDTAAYSLIPQSKAVAPVARFASNVARYGTIPGALEGLKNGKPVKGAVTGTTIASGLLAGMPIVGKVAKQAVKLAPQLGGTVAKTLGRLNPKTLEVATRPGSKALDLTPEEAQNLLMNTTEAVRNDYNALLTDKGNQVGRLLADLPEEQTFRAGDILQDYDKIYNNYSLSKNPALNPARNATTKELYKIEDLLQGKNAGTLNANNNPVTPKELYDINKNISNMVDWNKTDSALKNDVLEQMYGANAERISNLSPELAEANKTYSDLMDFQKNEGIRRILNNSNNIDTASSALKNYNSTVTKGNTNRNIQDLEKILTDEGYAPFINEIDDVNAAMDLNNIRTTGDSFWANVGTQLARPILKGARAYNSSNIPVFLEKVKPGLDWLGGVARRVVPAAGVSIPTLYGGIEYNNYQ